MSLCRKPLVSIALALVALAGAAQSAQANLLANGSFENPVASSGYDGSYCYLAGAAFPCGTFSGFGWTGNAPVMRAGSGAWGLPGNLGGYSYGSQLVGLQNASHFEQTVALSAGTYALDWADAGRSGYNSTQYDVYFDGVKLNALSFATSGGQAWSRHNLAFTASGSGELRFQGLAVNPDGTAFIDDVVLTAHGSQVPEPASLAMVLIGLVAMGGATRRKPSR